MSGKKGQGTVYTEDLGTRICEALAEGRTLRSVCEPDGMPSDVTVRRWAADPDHPFAVHYAHAREVGYHKMADDLVDIADGKAISWTEQDADAVADAVNPSVVQRDRLRVDTRKWLLSKALPKIYGDKVEVGGSSDNPIRHAVEVTFVGAKPGGTAGSVPRPLDAK